MSSTHKRMKNWVVSWWIFLKGWKISAQKRKWKSIFSGKRYQILLLRTYLAFLRKELEFFFPKIDIKSSISTQKFWGIKKKPGRCLPRLECTFESTVENISGKPWKVRLTVQNNHNFLGKNVTKKSSAHKNWKTRTFVEDFSIIVWKFPARGTWFKNRCIWKRLPKCSFAQVFWNLEIRVNFVKLKLQEKFVQNLRKMIMFSGKKTSRTIFCTSWIHFQKVCRNVFIRRQNLISQSAKNVSIFKNDTKCPLLTKHRILGIFWKSLSQRLKALRQLYRIEKKTFLGEKNTEFLFCTPVLLCLEKCRVFLTKFSTKHAQVPKNFWGIKKKRVGCLPHLECTFEKTVENFSVQAQIFRLTVRKKT